MTRANAQQGNALWFILIVIVLLGGLTMLLSRSGSDVDQSADVEQLRVQASQIIRYAKSLETAIDQMRGRGVSENDISFDNAETATDYTNANCTTSNCLVFDVGGGGQTYLAPPEGVNDGSDWIFTGANNVGTAAGPIGTTVNGTGNDIVILLPKASSALCKQINRDFGVGTAGIIPTDDEGILTAAFTGTYQSAGLNIIDGDVAPFELNNKTGGCVIDTVPNPDVTYFYYVLLAR